MSVYHISAGIQNTLHLLPHVQIFFLSEMWTGVMNNRAISAQRENRTLDPHLVNRPPKMLQTTAASVFQEIRDRR